MASKTPAKRKAQPKKADEEFDDLTDVDYDEANEQFTAEVFGSGERFLFSTDVNAFLLMNAARDLRGGAFLDLMDSLVTVPDGEDAEDERKRFHDTLGSVRHLTVERLAAFVAAITDAAGNEDGGSSPDD